MLVSHHQNAGQNHGIKTASFENVSQFKYLEMTITNQNLFQEEIKRRVIVVIFATVQSKISILLSGVGKSKHQNIQDYAFACCSVWV
jgi:hypothetical protein